MMPVPSYQLIPFLAWLHQRGFVPSEGSLNREHLRGLAREFIQTRGVGGRGLPHDLASLMLVFQACPMIREPDIESQMGHFAGCGSCLHHMMERRHGHRIALSADALHPLLQRFVAWSHSRTLDEYIRHVASMAREGRDEDPSHAFHRLIHEVGDRLRSHFDRFLSEVRESEPHLISSYEEWRRRHEHDMVGPIEIWPQHLEENTAPIGPNVSSEDAAWRLAESAMLAFEGEFYGQSTEGSPALFRLISGFPGSHQNLSRAIAFISWLQAEYPKLRIPGNMPAAELEGMAREFASISGYSDRAEFAREVTHWLYGDAPTGIIARLTTMLGFGAHSRRTKRGVEGQNPLDRYGNTKFHGLFLFHSAGDFPGFLKDRWQDLHHATGDDLDIYYTARDLAERTSGHQIAKELGAKTITVTDLPALFLWEREMDGAVVQLESLSHDQIMHVVQEVVKAIQDRLDLAKIAERGNAKANELRRRSTGGMYVGPGATVIGRLEIAKQENVMGDHYEAHGSTIGVQGHANDNTIIQAGNQQVEHPQLSKEDAEMLKEASKKLGEWAAANNQGDVFHGAAMLSDIAAAAENRQLAGDLLAKWKQWVVALGERAKSVLAVVADAITVGTALAGYLGIAQVL